LSRNGEPVSVRDWGAQNIEQVLAVAEELDRHNAKDSYAAAVHLMRGIVEVPGDTPSARIISELEQSNSGFFDFALSMARSHRDYFASIADANDEAIRALDNEAVESLQRQAEIEASDTLSLDEYLANYFA